MRDLLQTTYWSGAIHTPQFRISSLVSGARPTVLRKKKKKGTYRARQDTPPHPSQQQTGSTSGALTRPSDFSLNRPSHDNPGAHARARHWLLEP